jgi:hypothetical protein
MLWCVGARCKLQLPQRPRACKHRQDAPRPEPSDDTLVINELIREYLIFNGYRDTLSVFLPESGHPQTRPFDRQFLVCAWWDGPACMLQQVGGLRWPLPWRSSPHDTADAARPAVCAQASRLRLDDTPQAQQV